MNLSDLKIYIIGGFIGAFLYIVIDNYENWYTIWETLNSFWVMVFLLSLFVFGVRLLSPLRGTWRILFTAPLGSICVIFGIHAFIDNPESWIPYVSIGLGFFIWFSTEQWFRGGSRINSQAIIDHIIDQPGGQRPVNEQKVTNNRLEFQFQKRGTGHWETQMSSDLETDQSITFKLDNMERTLGNDFRVRCLCNGKVTDIRS